MTTRAYLEVLPLLLSQRAAAHLLGIDRSGPVFKELVRTGRLTLVPAGRRLRIPLEAVQCVAREGFGSPGVPTPRRRLSRRRAGTQNPELLRRLDVASLRRTGRGEGAA